MNTMEAAFEAEMDATSRVYSLRPGHVLTQEDFDAIQLFDAASRRDQERATDAFHAGYQSGLKDGGSSDAAMLTNKVADLRTELFAQKALTAFARQDAKMGRLPLFLNMIRLIHGIDGHELSGLDSGAVRRFLDNPARFLMKADDATAAIVWQAIQNRIKPSPERAAADQPA